MYTFTSDSRSRLLRDQNCVSPSRHIDDRFERGTRQRTARWARIIIRHHYSRSRYTQHRERERNRGDAKSPLPIYSRRRRKRLPPTRRLNFTRRRSRVRLFRRRSSRGASSPTPHSIEPPVRVVVVDSIHSRRALHPRDAASFSTREVDIISPSGADVNIVPPVAVLSSGRNGGRFSGHQKLMGSTGSSGERNPSDHAGRIERQMLIWKIFVHTAAAAIGSLA